MKSRVFKLTFFLFICSSIHAQIDPEIKEIWYDKTPVSGDIRVGIIDEIDEDKIYPNPEAYYAYIANEPTEGLKLCTVISSRDGRYKGDLSAELTEDMRGKMNKINWNSDHEKHLAQMKKSEITMISMVAESCDAEPKYYTMSQWSNEQTETIFIALNSEKKPYVKIETEGSSPDIKCKCEKLEGETNVNYNYICEVPYESYKNADRINVIQRVVRLSNMTSITYPINLKIPEYD